ncbi:MAG: hypothetical protein MZW92_56470 [Comamonadaceae bacterium]|nr:hypothetical protein [Comamonadaceae bacterium]
MNLIPLNPAPEIPFQAPTPGGRRRLRHGARRRRASPCPVRRPRGRDILAACGQLHLKKGAPRPPRPAPDDPAPSPRPASRPSLAPRAGPPRAPPARTSARRRSSGPRSTSSTPRGGWWRAATGSSRGTRASPSSTSRSSPTG